MDKKKLKNINSTRPPEQPTRRTKKRKPNVKQYGDAIWKEIKRHPLETEIRPRINLLDYITISDDFFVE